MHMHMYVYGDMCAGVYICTYMCMVVCVQVYMYMQHTCVWCHVCAGVYIYVYDVCVCVSAYVHIRVYGVMCAGAYAYTCVQCYVCAGVYGVMSYVYVSYVCRCICICNICVYGVMCVQVYKYMCMVLCVCRSINTCVWCYVCAGVLSDDAWRRMADCSSCQ